MWVECLLCLFGLFLGLFEGLVFGYDQAGRKWATSQNLIFDSASDTDNAVGDDEAQDEPLAAPHLPQGVQRLQLFQ